MKMHYVQGDATLAGNGFLLHVCNDIGLWGAGFSGAISRRWIFPEQVFKACFKKRLQASPGHIQMVPVSATLVVVNMIAQRGVTNPKNRHPLDYQALRICLLEVEAHMTMNVFGTYPRVLHMPRIGCGLGGGNWDNVFSVIESVWGNSDINITVYDV